MGSKQTGHTNTGCCRNLALGWFLLSLTSAWYSRIWKHARHDPASSPPTCSIFRPRLLPLGSHGLTRRKVTVSAAKSGMAAAYPPGRCGANGVPRVGPAPSHRQSGSGRSTCCVPLFGRGTPRAMLTRSTASAHGEEKGRIRLVPFLGERRSAAACTVGVYPIPMSGTACTFEPNRLVLRFLDGHAGLSKSLS